MKANNQNLVTIFHKRLWISHSRMKHFSLLTIIHHNGIVETTTPQASTRVFKKTTKELVNRIQRILLHLPIIPNNEGTIASSTHKNRAILTLKNLGHTGVKVVREGIMDK